VSSCVRCYSPNHCSSSQSSCAWQRHSTRKKPSADRRGRYYGRRGGAEVLLDSSGARSSWQASICPKFGNRKRVEHAILLRCMFGRLMRFRKRSGPESRFDFFLPLTTASVSLLSARFTKFCHKADSKMFLGCSANRTVTNSKSRGLIEQTDSK
jgi:hypothetical protein